MMCTIGSSPLTRGKRERCLQTSDQRRLIPAHAGKTGSALRLPRTGAAHPGSRGENDMYQVVNARRGGSSPLTRGKPRVESEAVDLLRLIPAHAGKTLSLARSLRAVAAHPRSRGENGFARRLSRRTFGSSPLTRGKQRLAVRRS